MVQDERNHTEAQSHRHHHIEAPHDRDCAYEGMKLAGKAGFYGACYAASYLTWNQAVPAGFTISRYVASKAGFGGLLGLLYAASTCMVQSLGHTDATDPFGSAFGGLMSGMLVGLQQRSFPLMAGLGAGFAAAGFLYEWNGRTLIGKVGQMSFKDKQTWHTNTFWRDPSMAPVNRALEIIDRVDKRREQE